MEKKLILDSYKNFLKICNFDFQILVQSKKENISKTISQLKNINEKNIKILNIRDEYINYLIKTNEEKKSSSKNFYIILRAKIDLPKAKNEDMSIFEEKCNEYLNENYFKIKESLGKCGNYICEISDKEDVLKIIQTFLK